MRWSEAVTLEFIKIYLNHECLWNPGHPGYRVKHQRDEAYADICTEFRSSTAKALTVAEVKVKIKNLRTTYVQQVHKILDKSSPDAMYEPSLVWFHEMDRCLRHVPGPAARPAAHLPVQQRSEVYSSCHIWVNNELKIESEANPDPLISTSHSDDDYDLELIKAEDSSDHITRMEGATYGAAKKKRFEHGSTTECANDDSIRSEEDEFDIYGKFIATQLRNMELEKAIRLQLEIQRLVSEARISDITN